MRRSGAEPSRGVCLTARHVALAALLTLAVAMALAAPAIAKTANVTDADVSLRLAPDGSLLVTERLTFNYDGRFEGSYRDIILRHGEQIEDVTLSQDGRVFQPGGNTALGSHDARVCVRNHAVR